MNITVNCKVLRTAVKAVQRVQYKGAPVESLRLMRIVQKGAYLSLCATDLKRLAVVPVEACVVTCPALQGIETPGFALPGPVHTIYANPKLVIAQLSKRKATESVQITAGEGDTVATLRFSAGQTVSIPIKGPDYEDFPDCPDMDLDNLYLDTEIPFATFIDVLRRVQNTISVDKSRYPLEHAHIKIVRGSMTVEATTGRAASCISADYEQPVQAGTFPDTDTGMAELLLHRDAIAAMTKTADKAFMKEHGASKVFVTVDKDRIRVVFAGDQQRYWTFTRAEGPYPPFDHIRPQDTCDIQIVAVADELSDAVRAASEVCTANYNAVLLDGSNGYGARGVVHVSAKVPGGGSFETEVPAVVRGQSKATLCFNPDYLVDAISNISSTHPENDTISIMAMSSNSPGLITCDARLADWQVVMPIRL